MNMPRIRIMTGLCLAGIFAVGIAVGHAAKVDFKQTLDVRWTTLRREAGGLRVFFEFTHGSRSSSTRTVLVSGNGKKLLDESGKALQAVPSSTLAKSLGQIPIVLDTLQTALMASGELTP